MNIYPAPGHLVELLHHSHRIGTVVSVSACQRYARVRLTNWHGQSHEVLVAVSEMVEVRPRVPVRRWIAGTGFKPTIIPVQRLRAL